MSLISNGDSYNLQMSSFNSNKDAMNVNGEKQNNK